MGYPAQLKRLLWPIRPLVGPLADVLVPSLPRAFRNAPPHMRLLLWKLATPLFWFSTGTFVVATKFGFEMFAPTTDGLNRYVYCFGVWEPNLTAWIAGRLREGQIFVDVGANHGYYTLLAARLVGPAGRVIAIEASPHIVPSLVRNLELNRVRNVRVENLAVTDEEGEVELFLGPATHCGITSIVRQKELRPGGTVRAKPLPAILTPDELAAARLFKIDVEGAECLVVRGLRDALARTDPQAEFVIEISPNRLALLGQSSQTIFDTFAAAGFKAYSIVNDYAVSSYLEPRPYEPPQRFAGPLTSQTDIVFSRRDLPHL